MARAAWIGTTVGYTDYYNSVFLETNDGRAIVVNKKTFDYLYHKLDEFTAALKEDCIEFAYNDPIIPDKEQPKWYVQLLHDGDIEDGCNGYIFHDYEGMLAISPNSVILRNFRGEIKYMEWDEFNKYYDVPRSEFID